MQEREVTSRIQRDELLGLIKSTSGEAQRITARMPAITLEQLLEPEPPPVDTVHVTFRAARGTGSTPPVRMPERVPERADTLLDGAGPEAHEALDDDRLPADDFEAEESASLVIGTMGGVAVHMLGPNPTDSARTKQITAQRAAVLAEATTSPSQVMTKVMPAASLAATLPDASNTGSQPAISISSLDAAIDAAVDAAIDAEIHAAEIEAAIDAVVLPTPASLAKNRVGIVALSFLLSFALGIWLMFMLG